MFPGRHPMSAAPRPKPPLGPTVIALSAVSLLTDVSSEMIYPLIPAFLMTTLGVSAGFVGVIEGAAETVASLVKLASGWWSDRVRRKPLVVAGYSLAALARPLVALATSGWHVLGIRLVDRVGKGIRSAPRDALLADAAPAESRGRAFGFHRAADNLGAVVGPLAAFVLLRWVGVPIRGVFWIASIPAALAVVVLVVAVKETGRRTRDAGVPPAAAADAGQLAVPLGGRFWGVLSAVFVFTLGNSTDAFLLLRAAELGVPVAFAPLIWALLNLVKSLSNTPGGALSDRAGRRPVVLAGWVLYAAVYVGFALATAAWHAWALFGLYGVVFGLTEGTEKALVADLAPAVRRGAAFGWYNLAIGIGTLPASLLFGALWNRHGSSVAFVAGASIAIAAACVLLAVPRAAPVSR